MRASPRATLGAVLGRVLCIDTLVLLYAAWTIGFWVALALGGGWVHALAFGFGAGVALGIVSGRLACTAPSPIPRSDDVGAMGVVLAVVVLWPVLSELGTAPLVGLACAAIAARVLVSAARLAVTPLEPGLLLVPAAAVAATVAYAASWTAMVLLACVIAVGVVARPDLPRRLFRPATAGGMATPPRKGLVGTLLGLFGVLIAVWHVGTDWWSADNAYYLNKAINFSENATHFEVRDYMFGVDGAIHYPLGNVLSSFEPLVGTISALVGVPVPQVLFQAVVPLSLLLVPFAMRYGARGLGARRADLTAAFAAAATLLMTGTVTVTLFAQASLGKTIATLVGMPIVLGAAGRLLRCRDATSALRAALAVVCTVGLSPSTAAAALLVVAPFTAATLWEHRTAAAAGGPRRVAQWVWLAVPLLLLATYSLYARELQRSAGDVQTTDGFLVVPSPRLAWNVAVSPLLPQSHLTDLLLVGGVAVLPLVLGDRRCRRAAGLMIVLILGVVFGPWTFDLVVRDLLGLAYFANRLFWALPIALTTGIALAALDSSRRWGVLTVLAGALALGLSGPTLSGSAIGAVHQGTVDVRHPPDTWPWDAGIPSHLAATADAIAAVTPPGGRYLAPPTIEEVTTGTHVEVFPTYVREVYVKPIGLADDVPREFRLEQRLLLARGMRGASMGVEAMVWRRALDDLAIDTVCTDDRTTAALRLVLAQTYTPLGAVGMCTELWAAPPPA